MSQKTNKSFKKRVKITGTKKNLVRKSGRGHFNAKKARTKQLQMKKLRKLFIDKKKVVHYLPKSR